MNNINHMLSTANHVSASFSTDFVWLLLTVKLVCCGGSGLTSSVGFISWKDSGSNRFVHLSALVVFKVACRVQIWKKAFCQNSDKFGYSVI